MRYCPRTSYQPVLLVLAFFVVQLDASIAAKWQLLILSAAATTAIFAALVLFVPPLRWLFGVRGRCPLREEEREYEDSLVRPGRR